MLEIYQDFHIVMINRKYLRIFDTTKDISSILSISMFLKLKNSFFASKSLLEIS